MIRINLRDDWREFIEAEAPKLRLRSSTTSTLEQHTIAFLNAQRRSVPRRPRVVHESREFQSQSIGQHATDYLALKKLIGEGGDLTPYLSRDVQRGRAGENDKTLNAWGLHHLHFRPSGTRDVLFVRITDSAVFVVKFLPHSSQHRDTWVDPSLLRILHDNWPEVGGVGTTAAERRGERGRHSFRLECPAAGGSVDKTEVRGRWLALLRSDA